MNKLRSCAALVGLVFALALAPGLRVPAQAQASTSTNFTKYIFVMRAPGQGFNQAHPSSINRAHFDEILKELPNRPGAKVQTGVSFIFSVFRTAPEITAASLSNFLHVAEETSTPVLIHLDTEQWWGARPDLWNWWDPARPGFDPGNRENVEWTGWSPDLAIKISWRNWGRQLRVLPAPNLASPRYLAACREELRRLVPLILSWRARLPAAKKDLLVGIKVGHESSIGVNAWYYPNGNELLDQPPENDPQHGLVAEDVLSRGVTQIGYAALKTSGIRSQGDITEADLAEATRRYLEFLCREAAQRGVPRHLLFSHGAGWKDGERMYDAAVNEFCCPGWSFYKHAADPLADPAVRRNLERSSAPYWGAVEWLLQRPHETKAWHDALTQTLADPRCRLVCIFNWESIRDSDEVKASIRQLVDDKP